MSLHRPFTHWIAALALAVTGSAFAQAKKEVTFAHQDMLVPLRIVQESGELEKATGYKINWRMFGGGPDCVLCAQPDFRLDRSGLSGHERVVLVSAQAHRHC